VAERALRQQLRLRRVDRAARRPPRARRRQRRPALLQGGALAGRHRPVPAVRRRSSARRSPTT
jgi:hypothetical protein